MNDVTAADPHERLVALVHDLGTPLSVVCGFAELLDTRGEALAPEQRADVTARVAASARELRAILDDARVDGVERPGHIERAARVGRPVV